MLLVDGMCGLSTTLGDSLEGRPDAEAGHGPYGAACPGVINRESAARDCEKDLKQFCFNVKCATFAMMSRSGQCHE